MRRKAMVYADLTYQGKQEWQDDSLPPFYWETLDIEVGDLVYNSLGQKAAEVVDVEKSYWGGGRREAIRLVVKLKAVYNTTSRTYVYDGKPLVIGEDLELNIGKTHFTGKIANIYLEPEERFADYKKARAEIKVKYRYYEPWHAEALADFEVLDSKGEVIARTKEIEILPAEKVVVTDRGEVLLRTDPTKKDVILTLGLPKVLCFDKVCFFNYFYTLMIGSDFWADSGKTWIGNGSIMDVKIYYDK